MLKLEKKKGLKETNYWCQYREDITTDCTDIKRIIGKYYRQLDD